MPLEFFSLENFRSVDAANTGQSIYVRPSPGQFACIRAELPYNRKTLTLLVDTACSGVVLSPSSVSRLKIPTFRNTFGSMAAAGGNVANTGVAQLESLKVGAITTGAMPAAVQDIGALPSGIDGIIGARCENVPAPRGTPPGYIVPVGANDQGYGGKGWPAEAAAAAARWYCAAATDA